MREVLLGLRLAATGGRSARLRAALTAGGVALGMVVLLVAASVPTMMHALDVRQAARDVALDVNTGARPITRGRDTLLVAYTETTFRGQGIRGQRLQAEGARAPAPPGLPRLPRAGELYASPALRALLAREPLLRERFDGRIAGTIGPANLNGPRELAFYQGADDLRAGRAQRIRRWGTRPAREALPGYLVLVLAVGVVVLLLPVGVFVATAVRFGSEQRDRRLAALRLVGADRAMAVRIAAGEALFGALGGMVLGAGLFLALRPLAERISLEDISVFAGDIRPDPALAVLIAVLVPVAALLASVVALRRVVVEPLGVSRRSAGARRRVWWRLAPLAAGGALLASQRGALVRGGGQASVTPIALGVGLMLVGITLLLPWLVDAAVRRLGGGDVAWQLAVRRLQMDGGIAARAVAGVAVAVAGAIALQTVLAEAQRTSTVLTQFPTRHDVRIGLDAHEGGVDGTLAALRSTLGVTDAVAVGVVNGRRTTIYVGDCASLREFGRLGACRDGDAFVTSRRLRPGRRAVGSARVPAGARHVPRRSSPDGFLSSRAVLLTPSAGRGIRLQSIDAYADVRGRDGLERVRNTVARLSPTAHADPVVYETRLGSYVTVRRGLFAGALCVLALIAASLLVGGLEQLRDRRPVLAALSAFGVPSRVMTRSVLWQTAVPVALGLAVSVSVGLTLGALLLRVGDQPFSADWGAIAAMTGAGAAVIVLVTVATLPAVRRHMRPEGLRAE